MYSTILSSEAHAGKFFNLRKCPHSESPEQIMECEGNPEFVAYWFEVRVDLRTSELVAGVLNQNSLAETVPSDSVVMQTLCNKKGQWEKSSQVETHQRPPKITRNVWVEHEPIELAGIGDQMPNVMAYEPLQKEE